MDSRASGFTDTRGFGEEYDRFIPSRPTNHLGYAQCMLTEGRKVNDPDCSPSKLAYRQLLAQALGVDRTRIFSFKSKTPPPRTLFPNNFMEPKISKPRRHIEKICESTLDAPNLLDDGGLNLLDWGSLNTLAVGLGSTAYLRNASGGTISELVIGEEEEDCVTSVCWAPDGIQLAVGLENSDIQLWDSTANHIVRTLRGGHAARVGALAWNHYILTTGRMDGKIINYDTRARRPIVGNYRGHKGEVCGLKWSPSGQQLASGGDDNLVYIWDVSSTSSNSTLKWLHKMDNHKAAVRALAWCPFQRNLLASGGGAGDKRIKFWNSETGACLNSVYIGAEVCSLIWSKNDRELLSSHGNPHNLTLREYPSMTKMAEFTGYTSRVLYMSQSPDGCRVASAGGEVLKTWKVFGSPKVAKRCESFGGCNRIQIR